MKGGGHTTAAGLGGGECSETVPDKKITVTLVSGIRTPRKVSRDGLTSWTPGP